MDWKVKDKELIEVSKGRFRWLKIGQRAEEKRSVNGVITDTMNAIPHPITGKFMDSKSEFRKITKAYGCLEVGNEKLENRPKLDLPPLKEDIAQAIRELER